MSASGTNKKFGRNEAKCKRYKLEQRREKHKVKSILQSNGLPAAEKYAGEKGVIGYLRSLLS